LGAPAEHGAALVDQKEEAMSTALFPQIAKSAFMRITGGRYDAMKVRLAKKGLEVPFNKLQLRARALDRMDGHYDGAIRCCYCGKHCTLEEVDFDHIIPLARGGSPCLDNIGFPCAPCNARKGDMRPEEFGALLTFLEKELPLARISILKRLQEHSKLLSHKRRSEAMLRGTKHVKIQRNAFLDEGF
jgi:hypothetical protein